MPTIEDLIKFGEMSSMKKEDPIEKIKRLALADSISSAFPAKPSFPKNVAELATNVGQVKTAPAMNEMPMAQASPTRDQLLQEQKMGLQELQKQFQAQSQPQKADMLQGILYGAADLFSNGKTKFLDSYKSQRDLDLEKQKENFAMSGLLQKYKGDLSNKEIDLLESDRKIASDDRRFDLKEKSDANRLDLLLRSQQFKENKPEKPHDFKDWQVQSATYGKRLAQAEDVFGNLEKSGYNRATLGQGTLDYLSGVSGLGNLTPETIKRQKQAERNFVTATLRKESGAAISDSEFKTAEQQYFPRAGDSPQVLDQKRANRRQIIEGMKLGAGPAWSQLAQVPSQVGLSTSKPKTVIQNGHKYTLNEVTGEYE